jgi:hypothetical protein
VADVDGPEPPDLRKGDSHDLGAVMCNTFVEGAHETEILEGDEHVLLQLWYGLPLCIPDMLDRRVYFP